MKHYIINIQDGGKTVWWECVAKNIKQAIHKARLQFPHASYINVTNDY